MKGRRIPYEQHDQRFHRLRSGRTPNFFAEHSTIALAFSGGMVPPLYLSMPNLRTNVHAYYVSTPFQPQFELDDAKLLAESLHADMTVLPFDVLDG